MARPKKNNADYFSHDANARNNPKIRHLKKKFGAIGYMLYFETLELLCGSDFHEFEIPKDDLDYELLADDLGVDPTDLKSFWDYTIKKKIFQSSKRKGGIFIRNMDLTESLQPLYNKRARQSEKVIASDKTAITPKGNPVIADENTVIADENIVIADENPQSKVKYSKVKDYNRGDHEKFFATFCSIFKISGSLNLFEIWINSVEGDDPKLVLSHAKGYMLQTEGTKYRRQPKNYLEKKTWKDIAIREEFLEEGSSRILPKPKYSYVK